MAKKSGILLFVKGLVLFLVGLYLASQGIPSDPTGAIVYAGSETMDALNESVNSPEASQVTGDTKSALIMLGGGAMLIGILEIIGSFIFIFK